MRSNFTLQLARPDHPPLHCRRSSDLDAGLAPAHTRRVSDVDVEIEPLSDFGADLVQLREIEAERAPPHTADPVSAPKPFVRLGSEIDPFCIGVIGLAVLLGTDIDQPRNLAKSVTVE